MVLLTLSVWVVPTHSRKIVFFIALYILSVGEGGHKPSVQTFAADQFDDSCWKAKASFFNWWYFGIVVGSSSALFVIIYLQVILINIYINNGVLLSCYIYLWE